MTTLWRSLACLAASAIVATAASARADIGARLQLVDCPLGSLVAGPTQFLWTSPTREHTEARTRDQIGVTTDPVSGLPAPVWGELRSAIDDSSTGAPGCMTYGSVSRVPEATGVLTTGEAVVSGGLRSATLSVPDAGGQGRVWAELARDFTLAAGASVTFTASLRVEAAGLDNPLDGFDMNFESPGEGQVQAGWTWLDYVGRAGASFGATVETDYVLGMFQFTQASGDLLRFTITNSGNEPLIGHFFSLAFVDLSQPWLPPVVPEPQTVWLLGIGLGVLWLRRRWRLS